MDKITIKYIPNLENAINIFSKDALIYYFNDFLNDEYKSNDLVKDYLDNFLLNKHQGLDKKIILLDIVNYEKVEDVNFYKSMYKNTYRVKQELLNNLFDNPFDFETITDNSIDVEYLNHNLKIFCKVPKELIETTIYQYKTSLNESLYSKLHIIPLTLTTESDLIEFQDNNFDYINDVMIRYNKSIIQMTDDEYDKIPKYIEKPTKSSKYITEIISNITLWNDNLNDYINKNLETYTDEDIIDIMNNLTNKNLNLNVIEDMFNNESILYENIVNNNIELEDVINNANNLLKKKEITKLLENFIKLKNNKKEEKEIINYLDNKDNVFKNSYKFSQELIEIIDNEDENNIEDNYFEYNTNILLVDNTLLIDNEKYKTEKVFIKELNFIIELEPMIKYLDKFENDQRLVAMIFYAYYTIQFNIYTTDIENTYTLNNECENLWYAYEEPLKLTDRLILPQSKSKSVYHYIICCIKNISNIIVENELKQISIEKLKILTGDDLQKLRENKLKKLTENELLNRLTKLLKSNKGCQEQLNNLQNIWDDIKQNIKGTDLDFYVSLIKNLKNSSKENNNIKYVNFVKALLYVTPKKLKYVNKYISGCCAQLLDQNYRAFRDILDITDKEDLKWFKDIKNYLQTNIIAYEKEWNATTYLSEELIEYKENFENFDNNIDIDRDDDDIDIENEINDIDEHISKYIENSSLLDTYVQECVDNFKMYIDTKKEHFSLTNFILNKCKLVYNLKNLVSIGRLNNSDFYYNCIDLFENVCCQNDNIKEKIKRSCIYISAKYLSELNENNDIIYEKIKLLDAKILTRQEYNKSINDYREKLKVKAIDVLENLSQEDKKIAMALKEFGIIKTYDNYVENNTTIEKKIIPIVKYNGEDDNDKPLY